MPRFRFFFPNLFLTVALGLATPATALGVTYVATESFAFRPLITTVDDPANHVVNTPSSFDGVADVIVEYPHATYRGSGALLRSGGKQFLLTAAHLVNDLGLLPSTLTASFPAQPASYSGIEYHLHPDWTGAYLNGMDIAIVRLNASVPALAYDILRTEIGTPTVGHPAGYGKSGTGVTGDVLPSGTLRHGQNTLGEAYWDILGTAYAFDFDNGTFSQNSILSVAGIPSDYGLGSDEVMVAPGDSGGPTFIDDKIAGVHSFIASAGPPSDIDELLNSSFGELAGDTRVAEVAEWIDQTAVPLPGAAYLLLTALSSLLLFGRWQRLGK